jgi:hypothetical protein
LFIGKFHSRGSGKNLLGLNGAGTITIGFLSLFSFKEFSSFSIGVKQVLIARISKKERNGLSIFRNHLLLPRSIFDILQCVAMMMSTIPICSSSGAAAAAIMTTIENNSTMIGTNTTRTSQIIFGSIGNEYTCKSQSFFIQLGLAVPSYNAMLCVYSFFIINRKTRDDVIGKYEPFMHVFSILLPLVSASIVVAANDIFHGFAIASCDNLRRAATVEEEEQDHYPFGATTDALNTSTLCYVWCIFIVILVCMIRIFRTAREAEAKVRRYSFQRPDGRNSVDTSSLSKIAAGNGSLYVASFILAYLFPTIIVLMKSVSVPYPIFLLRGIFMPTQGIFNFLAFISPKLHERCQRIDHDGTMRSLLRVTWTIIFNKEEDDSSTTDEERPRRSSLSRGGQLRRVRRWSNQSGEQEPTAVHDLTIQEEEESASKISLDLDFLSLIQDKQDGMNTTYDVLEEESHEAHHIDNNNWLQCLPPLKEAHHDEERDLA